MDPNPFQPGIFISKTVSSTLFSVLRNTQKSGVFEGQFCVGKSRDMLALGPLTTAGSDYPITWLLSLPIVY